MSEFMDLLLKAEVKAFALPTAEVRIKRFTKIFGKDATLTVRAIPFETIEDLRDGSKGGEFRLKMIREGVQDFDFSSDALREKLGVDKNLPSVEVIKKLFTAGEIEELYLMISKISGYGADTVEEIKKK